MLKLCLLWGSALLLLVLTEAGRAQPCESSGFFALVDNTDEFYACDKNSAGGYTLRNLRCETGAVFSSEMGKCVDWETLIDREDGNIENPTVPDDNTSTTAVVVPEDDKSSSSTADPEDEKSSSSTADPEDDKSSSSTADPEDDKSSSSTADPEDDKSSSSTSDPEDDKSSSSTAATDDDKSSSSTDFTPDDDNSSSSSGVTKDDDDSSSSSGVTKDDDDDSSSSAVTDDTDHSSSTEVTPSPLPDDKICATSGFQPKSGNCSQFVYCYEEKNEYYPFTFDCPEGMQFNPVRGYCMEDYDCTKE